MAIDKNRSRCQYYQTANLFCTLSNTSATIILGWHSTSFHRYATSATFNKSNTLNHQCQCLCNWYTFSASAMIKIEIQQIVGQNCWKSWHKSLCKFPILKKYTCFGRAQKKKRVSGCLVHTYDKSIDRYSPKLDNSITVVGQPEISCHQSQVMAIDKNWSQRQYYQTANVFCRLSH